MTLTFDRNVTAVGNAAGITIDGNNCTPPVTGTGTPNVTVTTGGASDPGLAYVVAALAAITFAGGGSLVYPQSGTTT